MPSEASAPGLARTFFSVFHLGGANFLSSNRIRPNHLLHRARNIILDGVHALSQYMAPAAPVIATPEEVCTPTRLNTSDQQSLISYLVN